ncbi:hypothetical protein [Austwickia chelonae]|uniref:hypothetical protein n=1 Tax=Austwickia chelonae TaxID=100225 RepID=UPI00058B9189|nr:hypothetical protein [Austwickia chelonae]
MPELLEKLVQQPRPQHGGVAVAQAFTDPKADALTKTAATLSVVPGLGQALGIADGIKHENTEEIVVQSISLAGLLAAQAIPVVGEAVDFGLLVYQLVETIVDLATHLSSAAANPPTEATDSVRPAVSLGLRAGWKTEEDAKLHIGSPYGMKFQRIVLSAEEGKEIPFVRAAVAVDSKFLKINGPRSFVVQNGIKTPMACFETEGNLAFCRPSRPIFLSSSSPATLHLSYVTNEHENGTIKNPTVDILGQRIVENKVITANKVSLVYKVDSSNTL